MFCALSQNHQQYFKKKNNEHLEVICLEISIKNDTNISLLGQVFVKQIFCILVHVTQEPFGSLKF